MTLKSATTATVSVASGAQQTISAPVILASNATLSTNSGAQLLVSGAISETGGSRTVTKTGTGVAELSGTNSYTGTTTVSAGELIVSGSLAGNVTVAPGAILGSGGNGNLNSQVAALLASSDTSLGATVTPGGDGGSGTTSIGRLNADGNVTLGTLGASTPATLKIEIGGTAAGSSYDQLNVKGAARSVNLDNVALSITAVNGYAFQNPAYDNANSQFFTTGATFFILTLADNGSTLNGTFVGTQGADPNLPGFSTINLGGQLFAINYSADSGSGQFNSSGNDVAIMAIPEPNSLAMLAGSLGMALGLQRFRRRRS